jgi:ribosomal protein S18 acetylase RimI-like enzyme
MSVSPCARPTTPPLPARWVDYADPLVVPMLRELDREYDARYGHSLGDLDEEAARERERFGPPDGGVVLLLEDGTPVAGGAFRRWDDDGTAELKRVWTDSAHRRRGLARRVLDELEAEIARRGYRRIFLTTGPRQPEAQGLYLAAGYRPLYDRSRPAEEIGPHPFEKTVRP